MRWRLFVANLKVLSLSLKANSYQLLQWKSGDGQSTLPELLGSWGFMDRDAVAYHLSIHFV